jgi:hypothetical protein
MEFEYALLIGVMSMKKFILSFASAFMIITSGASSMEGLALGAAQGLLPLLEPIVQETVVDGIKHLKKVATGQTCPLGCRKGGGLYCKAEKGLSTCKAVCQKISQVGGYELRIRFSVNKDGELDWSLADCVRQGIQDGTKTSVGKGKTKSIALYSLEDYKSVLKLISLQMAARDVINSQGKLTEEVLKTKGMSREKAIKEAGDLIKHIEASIEQNVKEGIYGNQ